MDGDFDQVLLEEELLVLLLLASLIMIGTRVLHYRASKGLGCGVRALPTMGAWRMGAELRFLSFPRPALSCHL